MEKIKIKKMIPGFRQDMLLGKVETVISNLNLFQKEAEKDGWENMTFELERNWDDPDDICAWGENWETDKEFAARKKDLEDKLKRQEKKLEKEKAQYEKLKQQFDGK